ncbi:RlpA-like double-psi beta-barrel-protein domain-containing protein-containing protein [Xylariaceae sp. FL0662B]|nr:RlpA-like double-psi beta-barrel-protein domain-containing protein-containing protein [Xylariaceae sp. FL0662B]
MKFVVTALALSINFRMSVAALEPEHIGIVQKLDERAISDDLIFGRSFSCSDNNPTTCCATVLALSCAVGYAIAFVGDLTYYEPGLGSCGWTNSDSEQVVALSPAQYARDPAACGKTIQITKDGKTVTAKVVDKCPSCSEGSIDVSSTVFQQLAPLTVGRTQVEWDFVS